MVPKSTAVIFNKIIACTIEYNLIYGTFMKQCCYANNNNNLCTTYSILLRTVLNLLNVNNKKINITKRNVENFPEMIMINNMS